MTSTQEATVHLTTAELAERFRTAPSTVHGWHHRGTGPLGIRFGRQVLYPLPEVEACEQEQVADARREQQRRANPRAVTTVRPTIVTSVRDAQRKWAAD